MCKQGITIPMPIGGRVRDIDSCIAPIVAALNAGGVETIASCCGHGKIPGSIILDGDKWLVLYPNRKMGLKYGAVKLKKHS
jgi:hypothetical protein